MALVIALPLRSLGEESRGGLPREETGFHLGLIVGFHERQDLVGRYQPRRPAKVQLTDQVRITRRLETDVDGLKPVRSRNPSSRDSNSFVSGSMPLTLKEFWQESQNLGNRTIS